MSKEIEELKSEIEALALKIKRLEAGEFEFCGDGYTVFCGGGITAQVFQPAKEFAGINKTEEQAIKRRRMLYLQNVEFQLAEHFNAGEECDWSANNGDAGETKYSINFSHFTKAWIIAEHYYSQRLAASYFISTKAAEKALPYYIEAVERYDRGEV